MKSPDIRPAIQDNRDDLDELHGPGVIPGEDGVPHPGSMGDALAKMAQNYRDGVYDTPEEYGSKNGVPPEVKVITAEYRRKREGLAAAPAGSVVIKYVKGRESVLGGRFPR